VRGRAPWETGWVGCGAAGCQLGNRRQATGWVNPGVAFGSEKKAVAWREA